MNLYSAGHIADDKADVFAYLMVVHHYVEERGRKDPIIRTKIELITRRLLGFSPEMDADFWAFGQKHRARRHALYSAIAMNDVVNELVG